MTEVTRNWNGATITAKSGTVRSRLQQGRLWNALDVDPRDLSQAEFFEWSQYFWVLNHCTVTGDLGFELGSMSADAEVLKAGKEAFMNAPEELWDTISELMVAVNPETDEALKPDPKGS